MPDRSYFRTGATKEAGMRFRIVLLAAATTLAATAVTAEAQSIQQGPGYGPMYGPHGGYMHMHPGYGHMQGYGQGYGHMQGYGRMQGYGFGRGPMMGGDDDFGAGPRWRRGDMPGRGRFAMIDANEDGVVSAEEAASAADEVFAAMDSDDDGMLTKEEYMSVRMGPQRGWNQARQQQRQQAKEARFDDMDTDGDGSITKAEFLTLAERHHMSADADGDGKVTPWEHRRRNWN
jgi:hypothetical protein